MSTSAVAGLGLLPEDLQLPLVLLLCLVALLQWLVLVPLAMRKGVVRTLDDVQDEGIQSAREKRPLRKDLWFVLWNIFPFVMVGLIVYVDHFWASWVGSLSQVYAALPQAMEGFDSVWGAGLITWAILLVAVVGSLAQVPKQNQFIWSKSHAYWWDRRISKRIFGIRMVVLVTNMVVFLAGVATVLRCYHLSFMVAWMDPAPIYLHPDSSAGISALGEVALCGTLVLVFLAGCGVVAFLDHKGQGQVHRVGDLSLISLAVVASIAFSVPLAHAHRAVLEAHRADTAELSANLREHTLSAVQSGRNDQLGDTADMALAVARPLYPANLETFLQLLISFLLPVLTYARRVFPKQLKGLILEEES